MSYNKSSRVISRRTKKPPTGKKVPQYNRNTLRLKTHAIVPHERQMGNRDNGKMVVPAFVQIENEQKIVHRSTPCVSEDEMCTPSLLDIAFCACANSREDERPVRKRKGKNGATLSPGLQSTEPEENDEVHSEAEDNGGSYLDYFFDTTSTPASEKELLPPSFR